MCDIVSTMHPNVLDGVCVTFDIAGGTVGGFAFLINLVALGGEAKLSTDFALPSTAVFAPLIYE